MYTSNNWSFLAALLVIVSALVACSETQKPSVSADQAISKSVISKTVEQKVTADNIADFRTRSIQDEVFILCYLIVFTTVTLAMIRAIKMAVSPLAALIQAMR